jgi:chorismate mutase-like protein
METTKEEIRRWRSRIDKIDLKLVDLLNKRAKCAEEIGNHKRKFEIDVCLPEREKEVMQNVQAANHGPLSGKAIKRIFKCIINESRSVQHLTLKKERRKNEEA